MKKLGLLYLALVWWGCGGAVDELTPYVQGLKALEKYNDTLLQYEGYLLDADQVSKAYDLHTVLEALQKDIEALPAPESDKTLKALHNSLKRDVTKALKKLKDPESVTFVPNAQGKVKDVQESIIKTYNNLARLWKEEGKPGPFPLKWPEKRS